jgi:hypothetical protein
MTVHEFSVAIDTAAIEAKRRPLCLRRISRFRDGVQVGDGVVITSRDGDVFIGDVDDADDVFVYVKLR